MGTSYLILKMLALAAVIPLLVLTSAFLYSLYGGLIRQGEMASQHYRRLHQEYAYLYTKSNNLLAELKALNNAAVEKVLVKYVVPARRGAPAATK